MIVFKNSKDEFFLENHKPHDVTVHDIQTDQQSGLVQQKKHFIHIITHVFCCKVTNSAKWKNICKDQFGGRVVWWWWWWRGWMSPRQQTSTLLKRPWARHWIPTSPGTSVTLPTLTFDLTVEGIGTTLENQLSLFQTFRSTAHSSKLILHHQWGLQKL